MSIIVEESNELTGDERLEAKRKRGMDTVECTKRNKLSKRYMSVMLIISIFTLSICITGIAYGSSAIIVIKYNFDSLTDGIGDITPTEELRIRYKGEFINPEDATFSPSMIFVGLLYPKVDVFFNDEFYMTQFPDNLVSEELIDAEDILEGYEDYFFASYIHIVNTSIPTEFKIRVSADFRVMIKLIVDVNVTDPEKEDGSIAFIYITDRTVDSFYRPHGICTYDVYNALTTTFEITGLEYNYESVGSYFWDWNSEMDIVEYPFVLLGTHTTTFNIGDYLGVR